MRFHHTLYLLIICLPNQNTSSLSYLLLHHWYRVQCLCYYLLNEYVNEKNIIASVLQNIEVGAAKLLV